jgi:hypothetical protein
MASDNETTDFGPFWRDRLVTDAVVAEFLGMGKSTVWKQVAEDPEFPKPIKWGERAPRKCDGRVDAKFTRWRFGDVVDFARRKGSGAA